MDQGVAQARRDRAGSALRSGPSARRAAGDGHDAALRRVGSKLLGQLHHCLAHRQPYHEEHAWTPAHQDLQLA